MTFDELAAKAREVQKMIIAAPTEAPPGLLWQRILAVCGQAKNLNLSSLDLELGSRLAADQVKEIIAAEPLPENLTFVYFGFYDSLGSDASARPVRVGFYLAGGTDINCWEALEHGDLSYFPINRHLHLDMLDRIMYESPELLNKRDVFEFLLLFGAAAVIARSVVSQLGLHLPTFVGFDSGDFFKVA
jgi:hypothetical protein